MLKNKVHNSFYQLKGYCESENFCGWDPYDGLNSLVFRVLPFKYSKLCRLLWIKPSISLGDSIFSWVYLKPLPVVHCQYSNEISKWVLI